MQSVKAYAVSIIRIGTRLVFYSLYAVVGVSGALINYLKPREGGTYASNEYFNLVERLANKVVQQAKNLFDKREYCFFFVKYRHGFFDLNLAFPSTYIRIAEIFYGYNKNKTRYEPIMSTMFERILQTGKFGAFLDIGAFVGLYTVHAQRIDDRIKCLAVEGNVSFYKCLEENTRNLPNVICQHVILSDEDHGTVVPESLYLQKLVNTELNQSGAPTMSLDRLCAERSFSPQIVKIDTDGSEGLIIAGAKEVFKNSVQCLLLELTPEKRLVDRSKIYNSKSIFTTLAGLGFEVYYICGHRESLSAAYDKFTQTGSLVYFRLTHENFAQIMSDHVTDVLIVATRNFDFAEVFGPSVSIWDA